MEDESAVIIDIPNEPSFVEFFKSMPECGSKVIRLFYRGKLNFHLKLNALPYFLN